MDTETLFRAAGYINEAYLSAADSAGQVRKEIAREKKRRVRILAFSVAALAVVLAVGVTLTKNKTPAIVSEETQPAVSQTTPAVVGSTTNALFTESSVRPESSGGLAVSETTLSSVPASEQSEQSTDGSQEPGLVVAFSQPSGGDTYGDSTGGAFIPALPKTTGAPAGILVTGPAISDEEAKIYFRDNYPKILGSLAASGVAADSLRIAEKGYCHVSYDGTEGKMLELRQNFRDYLVYSGKSLVAIVTLVKDEDGTLWDSCAFGAPWFSSFDYYLQSHKGEDILFIYAGMAEFAMTPGSIISTVGNIDPTQYIDFSDYAYFYHPSAVYVPPTDGGQNIPE